MFLCPNSSHFAQNEKREEEAEKEKERNVGNREQFLTGQLRVSC